jgi:hypothetical protein
VRFAASPDAATAPMALMALISFPFFTNQLSAETAILLGLSYVFFYKSTYCKYRY